MFTTNFSMATPKARYYDEINKIWYGPKTAIDIPSNISLGQFVLQSLRDQNGNNILQVNDSDGISLTVKDVLTMSVKIAKYLQQFDLQQSDVVCVIAKNSTYVLPIILGILFNNNILTTMNADKMFFEPFEKKFLLTHPKVIFCDGDILNSVQESLDNVNLTAVIITINNNLSSHKTIKDILDSEDNSNDFVVPILTTSQDVSAIVIWSSGTTGPSKGAAVTHRQLLARCKNSKTKLEEVVFAFSSVYWISGIFILIGSATRGVKRIITENRFDPSLMLKIVEKYQVNVLMTNPTELILTTQCEDLEFRDLTSLRQYACAGRQVPVIAAEKFNKKMENGYFVVAYGLTEAAGVLTIEIGCLVPGKVGKVLDNIQMIITDKHGKNLGINEIGEVCFKIECKWIGYFENPDATKAMCDSSGWIHSGDLGYFDENQCLFIVDRIKDIIRSRTWDISPTEIENIILQIDGIAEACVFAIEDPTIGDLPTAAVIKNIHGEYLTKEFIINYVAERMPEAKQLHGGVFFVDNLPKTVSGKVKRYDVKKSFKNILLK